MDFVELNADQHREAINTNQRFQAWRDAKARVDATRGSMVWAEVKGQSYLVRSYYDRGGIRRQRSLGPRSSDTERIKAEYERTREASVSRLKNLQPVIMRQAAVNRALGLGRVPLISARIIRALDRGGVLGSGIRVLGTNALYAYEAAAGVHIDPGLTATLDIDLLLDARKQLGFIAADEIEEASILRILQRVDKSFERTSESFRAVNRDGFLVDLIKPLRDPPWGPERTGVQHDRSDLSAVEITGLAWHENAPAFESTAIDERGEPVRIATSDPRVFAVHKLWLSTREDREPNKRMRDAGQARAVASLVAAYMPNLPLDWQELRMLPRELVTAASPLFAAAGPQTASDFGPS